MLALCIARPELLGDFGLLLVRLEYLLAGSVGLRPIGQDRLPEAIERYDLGMRQVPVELPSEIGRAVGEKIILGSRCQRVLRLKKPVRGRYR